MASVFLDSDGIIMIDYLEKGKIWSIVPCIKIKTSEVNNQVEMQDNIPIHTSQVEVANYGFELLPHTPYSLDLAPSDFFMFSKL